MPKMETEKENSLNSDENKKVFSVLNKYLTLEQIKKHEAEMESELRKINNIEQLLKDRTSPLSPIPFKHSRVHHFCELSIVTLERIEVDPKLQSIFNHLSHQICKMNEQIAKLQGFMNQNRSQETFGLFSSITHYTNNLILTTSFVISKLAYREEQILQSFDQSEAINEELRAQVHSLQSSIQLLKQNLSKSSDKETNLQSELSRVRSVMESYQRQNFQMRDEVHLLNQVIEQMNIQVEKGQRKVDGYRKELNILRQEHEKLIVYCQELELQFRGQMDVEIQVQRLQKMNERQEESIKKWKTRCFQQLK